ncbi:MAG: hypothetical protein EAX95_13750 [Candidatus Thorarchaeota archaeon]|nr:hypothetical protein [Candidatus Thorarchaeota archaeon]
MLQEWLHDWHRCTEARVYELRILLVAGFREFSLGVMQLDFKEDRHLLNGLELETYLKKTLPKHIDLQVLNFREITDGWETDIYSFDLGKRDGAKRDTEKLILRMYAGPWAKHKAIKEFNLLKRLRNIGYPVPIAHLIEENLAPLGRPFIIMERIDGSKLWDLMEGEKEESDWFTLFSRLFYELHKLDWHKLEEDPEEFKGLNSKMALLRWIEKCENRAKEIGRLELLQIVDWLKGRVDGVILGKISATHNDFHPNNILIDRSGVPFVIDWTAADILDYRVDIAWTLLLAKIYGGDSMRDAILKGYERVSQKKVEGLSFFEVVGSLRRLTDILVSFDADSENIGLRAGADEMMREQMAQNMVLLEIVKNHTGLEFPEILKFMEGKKT